MDSGGELRRFMREENLGSVSRGPGSAIGSAFASRADDLGFKSRPGEP